MEDRERVVALVGEPGRARDRLAATLDAAGVAVRPVENRPEAITRVDPAAVVTLGDSGLLAVAQAEGSVPVIPCNTGPRFASVDETTVATTLERLFDGSAQTAPQPVLEITVGGSRRGRALYDVLLLTTEPAEISEFSVATADNHVASFRADGIVTATPAGSEGYARAAGGPILGARTEAVAVVPIAPFRTRRDRWVFELSSTPILRVERDEEPISLVCDGRDVGPVPPETDVRITRGATLEVVITDQ